MAKENQLTGSAISTFTPDGSDKIELHTYLQRITDSRGPRVVVHEFPNRDGAKIETLGRKPHKTTWQITYTGADWRTWIVALVQALDANPAGMLVHPIYGQMRVVCHGFDQSILDIANATNTLQFDLTFTEDATDTTISTQGLAAQQQAANTAIANFQDAAAPYNAAATVSSVDNIVASAQSYVTAAFLAASTNTVDPSLQSLLDSVGSSLALAQQALEADPVAQESVAQTYDVLASAEVVYASCLDLADEVALETSGNRIYVVPGDTSIAVLAQTLYQARAISVLDQILTMNADVITDATNIASGTELVLPP